MKLLPAVAAVLLAASVGASAEVCTSTGTGPFFVVPTSVPGPYSAGPTEACQANGGELALVPANAQRAVRSLLQECLPADPTAWVATAPFFATPAYCAFYDGAAGRGVGISTKYQPQAVCSTNHAVLCTCRPGFEHRNGHCDKTLLWTFPARLEDPSAPPTSTPYPDEHLVLGETLTLQWPGPIPHNVVRNDRPEGGCQSADLPAFNAAIAANTPPPDGLTLELPAGVTPPVASPLFFSGTVTLSFPAPGTYVYICSVGMHCAASGMRLNVMVS